jgi:hypothetical protein
MEVGAGQLEGQLQSGHQVLVPDGQPGNDGLSIGALSLDALGLLMDGDGVDALSRMVVGFSG